MDLKFLDFEQPIAELEAKIEELRYVGDDSEINLALASGPRSAARIAALYTGLSGYDRAGLPGVAR